MHLLDLPEDLVGSLPFYLDSIHDLYSLIRCSRALYTICGRSNASLSPRLLETRDARHHPLQPHPHLLIAGTARQVGNWAVQSISNRNALHSAIIRGLEGLYELSMRVARMSLHAMRELHQIKYAAVHL